MRKIERTARRQREAGSPRPFFDSPRRNKSLPCEEYHSPWPPKQHPPQAATATVSLTSSTESLDYPGTTTTTTKTTVTMTHSLPRTSGAVSSKGTSFEHRQCSGPDITLMMTPIHIISIMISIQRVTVLIAGMVTHHLH